MSSIKIENLRLSLSSVDEPVELFSPQVRTSSSRVRIAGVHQLAGFEVVGNDKLIRVSKQDFWKLGEDDEGYYIERLVEDDKGPVCY
jgi:hypothetical protein